MAIDENEARKLWEQERGREYTDDEWLALIGAMLGPVPGDPARPLAWDRPSEALDDLESAEIRARRAFGIDEEPVDFAAPQSWRDYSTEFVRREYGPLAREVRDALGLAAPIPVEGVYLYLCHAEGEVSHAAHAKMEGAFRTVMEGTGLTRMEAAEIVLSDADYAVPWLRMTPVGELGGMNILVGSDQVRPDEVAAAYAMSRRNDLHLQEMGWPIPHTEYRRGPARGGETDPRPFCRKLREEGFRWQEIAERWNEEHPDQRYGAENPTKAGDILSRVCRRLDARSKGGGSDG